MHAERFLNKTPLNASLVFLYVALSSIGAVVLGEVHTHHGIWQA